MRAPERFWRTGDGRLVLDGDPAAAVLAYGPGDEVSAADAERLPGKEPDQSDTVDEDDQDVNDDEGDQDVTEDEPGPPDDAENEQEKKDAGDDEDKPEKKAAPAPVPKRQRGGRRKAPEGERW